MPLDLQCYASGDDAGWEAICIDFDIAVQDETYTAAKESLEKAIRMYLDRLAELPAEERAAFMARRSPWWIRATWVVRAYLGRIRDDMPREFTIHSDDRLAHA